MSAGERDMSDVEIWGRCGHKWLDFACYAAGALDDENDARAVEVQVVACAACSDELGDHLKVGGLIYEAVDVVRRSSGSAGLTPPAARVRRRTPESAAPAYPWCRARVDVTDGASCRTFPS